MILPELLSPAGDRERLEAAVRYGANAIYLGGTHFGMRAAAAFDDNQLCDAVKFAHENDVRVYVTCNTLPTNEEADELPEYLRLLERMRVDALIVADVGVLMLAKRIIPNIPIHISTQAGVVNYLTATELFKLGASRVVLARELSLEAIRVIRDKTPPELELEAFVHGAMCMSFSGRCLISSYLLQRDANRGECAQPCRWKYHLVEEKRPGQYYPIEENDEGSYILNAKDLCMIEQLDKLAAAGVSSFKIEGRAKSAYYVASITNAYTSAMKVLKLGQEKYEPPVWAVDEVFKVSHRAYSTGFYFGRPDQYLNSSGYIRDWDVICVVEGYENGYLIVSARNKFSCGQVAEVMLPGTKPEILTFSHIFDCDGEEVESARHPMRRYKIPCDVNYPIGVMIRRETLKGL